MPNDEGPELPAGWIGGFAESNARFAYPTPDLSSLHMLKNMDNIPLLQRQQKLRWPEFSWDTEPDSHDPKRCFQMFAPDISRLGYTDEGRVYSIICPQQGIETPSLGSVNVEVTVTGNRGWVDETTREFACDMSVEGRIWFGPGAHENHVVKLFWHVLDDLGHDFPISKETAIVVRTNEPGNPAQSIFELRKGESTRFEAPDFARHDDVAWTVGHIEVEVGDVEPTHIAAVDDFNRLILDIVNMASGNMLLHGNVLTWNVWLDRPAVVDQVEWRQHAETWRRSIDVDHTSPDRFRSPARFQDGTVLRPVDTIVDEEVDKIYEFLRKHLSLRQRLLRTGKAAARTLHLPRWLGG
jgi:hypothetical protein